MQYFSIKDKYAIYTKYLIPYYILQVCSAGSRLLVQENIADVMIAKVKERMTHLRVGDSLDKSIDMGAIVDVSQKKSIEEFIRKAKEEGAEVSITQYNSVYCVGVSSL